MEVGYFIYTIIITTLSVGAHLTVVPTVIKIYETESVHGFHLGHYLIKWINFIMWIAYALSIQDVVILLTPLAGLMVSTPTLAIMARYSSQKAYAVLLSSVGTMILLALFVAVTMQDELDRSDMLGSMATTTFLIMCTFPLVKLSRSAFCNRCDFEGYTSLLWALGENFLTWPWVFYSITIDPNEYLLVSSLGGAFGSTVVLLATLYQRAHANLQKENKVSTREGRV